MSKNAVAEVPVVEMHPLNDLCREVLDALNRAKAAPPARMKEPVDEAERAAVRFRDGLIERLRQEHTKAQGRQLHSALDRVNSVLSVVNALEYPAAGIQRELLEQARKVFRGLVRRKYE